MSLSVIYLLDNILNIIFSCNGCIFLKEIKSNSLWIYKLYKCSVIKLPIVSFSSFISIVNPFGKLSDGLIVIKFSFLLFKLIMIFLTLLHNSIIDL